MNMVNRKIINAVFNLDVKTFKDLLNAESFDSSLCQDIKFSEGTPCPIQWITQCWEIILEHPEDWTEECREKIIVNKKKNLEIKKIFEDKFNVVFEPIDFYNTDFWFFREERDASFEDVFGDETRESMIAKGHREIDLDLYIAVTKFDFKEAERLLELGANPVHEILEEGNYCMDRIGTECSLLGNELQAIMITGEQRDPLAYGTVDLINLIGLAANERMYTLLSKYDSRRDISQ